MQIVYDLSLLSISVANTIEDCDKVLYLLDYAITAVPTFYNVNKNYGLKKVISLTQNMIDFYDIPLNTLYRINALFSPFVYQVDLFLNEISRISLDRSQSIKRESDRELLKRCCD